MDGYWTVADSYVRQSREGKVTSLTVCCPKKDGLQAQLTFSDKVDPIRVKLDLAEVAEVSQI